MPSLTRRRFITAGAAGAVMGVAGCIEGARETTWGMFRAAANNEASTRESPGAEVAVDWSVDLAEHLGVDADAITPSSPIADAETAYLSCRLEGPDGDGTAAIAVDLADGTVRWHRTFERDWPSRATLVNPPTLWNDYLVVVDAGTVTVLNRADGRTWFDFGLPFVPGAIPGGEQHLLAIGGELVTVADLEEQRDVRWTDGGATVSTDHPLTVIEDRLFVPLEDRIRTYRRGDGELVGTHQVPIDEPTHIAAPLVDGFHMHQRLRGGDGTEELVALQRSDLAQERWRYTLGSTSAPSMAMHAISGSTVYATLGTEVVGIAVGNGDRILHTEVDVEAPYPTAGGDYLYLLGADALATVEGRAGDVEAVVDLPGEPAPRPQEAVPREEAVLVSRSDRLVGLR